MSKSRAQNDIDCINGIICNLPLADAIADSVSKALTHRLQVYLSETTVWEVFRRSRDLAIYDIENHERGALFRRLIKYGPSNPDEPEMSTSVDATTLSDPECGACVQFIYSHMVNRFKGGVG